MKVSLKSLMCWLVFLLIFFVEFTLAATMQEETIKLPNCDRNSFEIRFLQDTKYLYLKINRDCEQLVKALSDALHKPEYGSNDVAGYIFDLQGSKLSNRVDIYSELPSLFLDTDIPLQEKGLGGKRSGSTGRLSFQGQQLYYQPVKANRDDLQGLSKPLILLTGEATSESADNVIMSFFEQGKTIGLLGADIKGGFWTNDVHINTLFINQISKYFIVSNPVTSYSDAPNKKYLKYLDYFGTCSAEEYHSWVAAIASQVMSLASYPFSAQSIGIEGDGRIRIKALSTGVITNAEVSQSTGNEFLDQAMLDATKNLKIQPLSCRNSSRDDELVLSVPFRFKLQP